MCEGVQCEGVSLSLFDCNRVSGGTSPCSVSVLFFSDTNQDGIVTEDEFVAPPIEANDPSWLEADRAWQKERRKEFRNVIDLDRDGKLTKDELTVRAPAFVRLFEQNPESMCRCFFS